MNPLDLIGLTPLTDRTSGSPEVRIGLIDGPVAMNHPDLATESIRELGVHTRIGCARADSAACLHGTFVAGVLSGRRGSVAPAICPGCTLLVRPVFAETKLHNAQAPWATPEELTVAIIECVQAGAQVINLSLAVAESSIKAERELEEALHFAARRGVVIVVAAGNQGLVGSSSITRHPWVIPVVTFDLQGRPVNHSNLGGSFGRRGLGAPGEGVTSLGADGKPLMLGGTSVAAAFVTGTVALLWSEFPDASVSQIKIAVTSGHASRRTTIVPPLLNAWEAYQFLANAAVGR